MINNSAVTVGPGVSIRARLCQEGARRTARLKAETLSILANATKLLRAILFAVSLAAVDTANIPKVGVWARLLDVCESGVVGAEVTLFYGGAEDGDVHVRAITIDCQLLA